MYSKKNKYIKLTMELELVEPKIPLPKRCCFRKNCLIQNRLLVCVCACVRMRVGVCTPVTSDSLAEAV